ncbi:MAG: hypothetical protein HQL21_05520 [Candidatus Omnitrophica bacterium]|nr:hypothetical protein [Candidatus Omnitrophota bacterium]
MKQLLSIIVVLIIVSLGKISASFAIQVDEGFTEIVSEHFRARFLTSSDRELARRALDRAEYLYKRVARDIGYSRYDGYWTWEKRAGIILFPDQISFSRFTGQPAWSVGYASRESIFFHNKTIVSFSGQANFFDEVLPHELTHLMFWDYFDRHIASVPVWFEEGVAQLEETGKRGIAKDALRPVVQSGKHIQFRVLGNLRPSELNQDAQVGIYYAESLSIIVFLVEKYGQEAFYQLIKELRGGQSFEKALTRSYGGIFKSMDDLEGRWVRYILDE